ncbi:MULTISPECIES: 3D domain-containing protein [Bacillus]|uniref:3D domain-containing protein n=1 Tax=Bacillus TaxID=1386 RepID=UPI00037F0B0B|nr:MULTISPECIES: 3D domain-containing protein [Bacillus]
MKKTLLSIFTVATISTTVGLQAHAEEITIKKGDTLSEIAKEYDVSVSDLKAYNGLISDLIVENQKLTVVPKTNYKVLAGDSLWKIGQQFGVEVADIKTWNNLTDDLIFPNQNLVIHKTNTTVKNTTQENVKNENQKEQSKSEEPVEQPVKNDVTTSVEGDVVKTLTMEATAYSETGEGTTGMTATGLNLRANPNLKVIAVDPKVIPLGTKVYVEGYGYATAEDTGGAIKGNRIDVFIPSETEVNQWGRKQVQVKILR